ncbi:MAG: DUF2304 domain-containing protein [Acidimicrobiales bacterium]
MSTTAHILFSGVLVLTVLFIYSLVRQRVLKSKYALLWSLVAVALLPIAAVPSLVESVSDLLGIETPSNTILLAAVSLLFATTVQLTYELSRIEARTQDLAEEFALLRARLDLPAD